MLKAHGRVYHSTLGSRVITKRIEADLGADAKLGRITRIVTFSPSDAKSCREGPPADL